MAQYEKVIEVEPSCCNSYNGRGNALYGLAEYKKAISAYEKAIDLHPECPNPWRGKADAIWASQGIEQVIVFCDRSILELRKQGTDRSEVVGVLFSLQGDAYYQKGRTQYQYFRKSLNKSRRSYLAAIKIFEDLPVQDKYLDALQSVIKVLLGLNRVKESDELLRKGTEYLDRCLNEIPSHNDRKLLVLKFAGFDQLTVDRQIQAASQLTDDASIQEKWKEALITAEKGKNTCLSWLLYALSNRLYWN